jgi:hypothetical protein
LGDDFPAGSRVAAALDFHEHRDGVGVDEHVIQRPGSGVGLLRLDRKLPVHQQPLAGFTAGVYVQGVTVAAGSSGSSTAHLNKATQSALQVAWFVLN